MTQEKKEKYHWQQADKKVMKAGTMREKVTEGAALLFEPLPCFLRHYSEECVCIVQQIDPSAYRIGQGGGTALCLQTIQMQT